MLTPMQKRLQPKTKSPSSNLTPMQRRQAKQAPIALDAKDMVTAKYLNPNLAMLNQVDRISPASKNLGEAALTGRVKLLNETPNAMGEAALTERIKPTSQEEYYNSGLTNPNVKLNPVWQHMNREKTPATEPLTKYAVLPTMRAAAVPFETLYGGLKGLGDLATNKTSNPLAPFKEAGKSALGGILRVAPEDVQQSAKGNKLGNLLQTGLRSTENRPMNAGEALGIKNPVLNAGVSALTDVLTGGGILGKLGKAGDIASQVESGQRVVKTLSKVSQPSKKVVSPTIKTAEEELQDVITTPNPQRTETIANELRNLTQPTHTATIYGKGVKILPDTGDGNVRYLIKDATGREVGTTLPKAKFDSMATNVKPIGQTIKPGNGITPPIAGKTTVGANGGRTVVRNEPIIPEGQKERGFSANQRTDVNNPDVMRDSYTENPLSYDQIHGVDTVAKAQAIFDQGYESARTQLGNLTANMKPEAVPLSKMLARKLFSEGNATAGREVLSDVAQRLTEAGQFSQAARLLRESDPETFILTMDKQLKKLNEQGLKEYGNKWKNIDLTPDELDLVTKLKSGDDAAYETAFEQIGNRIANEMPAHLSEKLTAWRHVAMLLNPKTQIRNIGGNVLMMGMRRTAKQVSAILQNVFLKPEDRTQVFKVNSEYKQAAETFFEANKKDLLNQGNKFNEGIKLNMPNKRVFQNNALEETRKFTYKLLEWGDNPFYKNAYINRLSSYAQAKGIKDFSKLGKEAFDIAKREAEEATYKDASVIADFINRVKHPGKNASLGRKVVAVGTEAALPFTKTPINVIKRGIQYSPAGILNGLSKIKSAEGAAAAIDEIAKGLTGTAIMGLGILLAKNNILTGKAEKDTDLKNYNANTGNSPFSILGKYTYDWAQPFSVPLSVGVEIWNAVKDNPEEAKKMENAVTENNQSVLLQMAQKFGTGLLDGFNASGDTVFNMSILKGIRQLIGSGTQGVMEGFAQLPQNIAMQFVPTVANQAAGMIDPTVRQTYYSNKPLESAKAQLLSKIPFASKKLEPKLTPWGEPVKRPANPLLRAFSQFVSPGIVSVPQNINPEVDREIRRLGDLGETVQFPTVATNSFQWNGKFDLTPKEYTTYQKTLGQETLKAYANTINTTEYKALSDADKAKKLSSLISDSRDKAKFEIIKSRGVATNPLIMNVTTSLTDKGVTRKLTFEQQKELADLIGKYKQQKIKNYSLITNYSKNKEKWDKKAYDVAKEQAYNEMKKKLF